MKFTTKFLSVLMVPIFFMGTSFGQTRETNPKLQKNEISIQASKKTTRIAPRTFVKELGKREKQKFAKKKKEDLSSNLIASSYPIEIPDPKTEKQQSIKHSMFNGIKTSNTALGSISVYSEDETTAINYIFSCPLNDIENITLGNTVGYPQYGFDFDENGVGYSSDFEGKLFRNQADGTSEQIDQNDQYAYLNGYTYDLSTQKWYTADVFSLYEFDPTNLDTLYIGDFNAETDYLGDIAYDQDGNLYSIGLYDLSLYSIDKTTGAASKIGALNLDFDYTAYIPVMAFDHNTNTMYALIRQEFGEGVGQFYYSINLETGAATELGAVPTAPTIHHICGFGIPFEEEVPGAPGEVTDLELIADPNGNLAADVTFTTPTTTIGGDDLTTIDSIQISIKNEVVLTLTDVTVGTSYSENVTVDSLGRYVAQVCCFNAEGPGRIASTEAWIGLDAPGTLENVMATTIENGIKISWSAPTGGLHGGYFDGIVDKYIIARNDNYTIEVNGDLLEFTDETVNAGTYNYTIYAENSVGEGLSTTSNNTSIYVDEYLFYEDFNGDSFETLGWDYNGPWHISENNRAGGTPNEARLHYGYESGTFRLKSPEINTSGMSQLYLSFTHTLSNDYGYDVTLKIQTNSNNSDTWNDVWAFEIDDQDIHTEKIAAIIDNDDVGAEDFRIAVTAIGSIININDWYIDQIALKNIDGPDVRPTNLHLYGKVLSEKAMNPKASIKNQGANDVTCNVTCEISTDGEQIYSSTKNITLSAAEENDISFDNWTPTSEDYTIKVYTQLENDSYISNDTITTSVTGIGMVSPSFAINDSDEPSNLPSGVFIIDACAPSNFIPLEKIMDRGKIKPGLAFDKYGNIALSDLTKIEIVDTTDYSIIDTYYHTNIFDLVWSPQNALYYLVNGYDIYTMTDLSDGEMTMLPVENSYLSSITIDGDGVLWGLDWYNSSLVTINPETGETTVQYEITEFGVGSIDNISYDWNMGALYVSSYITNSYYLYFYGSLFSTGGYPNNTTLNSFACFGSGEEYDYASISGTVMNADDQTPIEGASITITRYFNDFEYTYNDATDENGYYSIPYLAAGSYDISVVTGSHNMQTASVTLSDGEDLVQNFVLTTSTLDVVFTVYDENQGAFEGADITLLEETISTNSDGIAVFENVSTGTHEFLVYAEGYYPITGMITLVNESLNIEINLTPNTNITRNFVVAEEGTGTWCPSCPGAAMGLDDLIEEGYALAVIAYHGDDEYEADFCQSRINYCDISGFPTVLFDGGLGDNVVVGGNPTQSLVEVYRPLVTNELNNSTPAAVEITSFSYDSTTRVVTGSAIANAYGVITSTDITFHAVLTESHIPDNWGVMTEVNFVARSMYPNVNGTSISLTTGQSASIDFEFTLDESWVAGNSDVIVFVQDNTTKEIYNADKHNVTDQGATTYSVSFRVTNIDTQDPVEGAVVELTGYGEIATDSTGVAAFENVEAENGITYTIEANGYYQNTGTVDIDSDVCIEVAIDPIGINELPANHVSIYPNPTRSYITVSSKTNLNSINVYDVLGNKILCIQNPDLNEKVQLENCKAGIYFIKVVSHTGLMATYKIIKQ